MIRSRRTCQIRTQSPRQGRAHAALVNQALRRGYLQVGDSPPAEDSFVLWLQAGSWFADIRVKLDGSNDHQAFGGVVHWQRPWLRFQHLVNISGTLSDTDIGRIILNPEGCLERGSFTYGDCQIPFEEQWLMQRPATTSRVYTRGHGALTGLEIQQDRYCIHLTTGGAACFERQGRAWCLRYRVGNLPPTCRPQPMTPIRDWRLVERVCGKTIR